MKEFFWWTYPPAAARQAYMVWDYYDTPKVRRDADRFIYFPTNKMVRRLGGGDRSDTPGGGDFTYDDILGREVFESFHKTIGFDYLYLDQCAYNFGKYDFIIFSYVISPLNEENGFNNLISGLLNIERICSYSGRVLILQDKFRTLLVRRISRAIGISSEKKVLTQQVFPKRNDSETYTYKYYCCLYAPHLKRKLAR